MNQGLNEDQLEVYHDLLLWSKVPVSAWNEALEGARRDHNFSIDLRNVDLSNRDLTGVDFSNVNLRGSNLSHSVLNGAKLTNSVLEECDLTGTKLVDAELASASFRAAIVDGRTLFRECIIDEDTDFYGVGLGSCRMEPDMLTSLEANMRRESWDQWCASQSRPVAIAVQAFWWVTKFGTSTKRPLSVFLAATFSFALIYSLGPMLNTRSWGGVWETPYVLGLSLQDIEPEGGGFVLWPRGRIFIHALYYSIVTMTTLGAGDIYANPESPSGQFLVSIHVVVGYLLLAALITRLSVLYTSISAIPAMKSRHDFPND